MSQLYTQPHLPCARLCIYFEQLHNSSNSRELLSNSYNCRELLPGRVITVAYGYSIVTTVLNCFPAVITGRKRVREKTVILRWITFNIYINDYNMAFLIFTLNVTARIFIIICLGYNPYATASRYNNMLSQQGESTSSPDLNSTQNLDVPTPLRKKRSINRPRPRSGGDLFQIASQNGKENENVSYILLFTYINIKNKKESSCRITSWLALVILNISQLRWWRYWNIEKNQVERKIYEI